ncbi:AAA15 family ATPase/GTPase [Methanohalophilus levihalophilus]|uniref:AAA family ATPase n=1 Tax=Methanohalophilus levihalophilus TaxID=1431282 RepID=UPI001AE6CA76|nr:ATP-binding protein [Methanohalophilus levihalophilus]MBP2030670.1 AAA15 family ATPase/GTPase [Methanohalophilus levihalophilus]
MLIEFSVENFLSFKEKVTLSMDSSSSKKIPQNLIELNKKEKLLKSAVIYGANSSGKSNFIKAMYFMQGLVLNSHNFNINSNIPVSPFKLSEECKKKPSNFEIKFIQNNKTYKYGFSCTSKKIVSEYLYDISKQNPKPIFTREKTKKFVFPIDEEQQNLLKSQTIDNTLYLSRATQLGYDKTKDAYDFFSKKIIVNIDLVNINPSWEGYTINKAYENSDFKKKILDVLKKADFGGIENIRIKKKKIPVKEFTFNFSHENSSFESKDGTDDVFSVQTMHKNEDGKIVYFDLNDESMGTKKTFLILGPLFDIIEKGNIAFIDELEQSLHPEITRLLVRMFNSKKNKDAQVIFTTHDTTLLDNEVFRRDQVYLFSKEQNSSTELSSLLDYDIRQEIDFERAYLNGRFGGVPLIDETLFD